MNYLPLSAVLKNVVDNRGKTCPVSDSGLPLIATNCVKNSSLFPSFEKVRYVSDETYRDWFRGHPKPGDLIFVLKGAPGQVCLTPDPVSFCIAQDMVALRADEKIIYPPYLFAALRSKYMQKAIVNMHVGTMIPHFKKGDFDKLDIPVPEEDVQKTIGDSYLEFSQKIELNRQMNATLEAMAQAVFKDWFVDFGPTVRKAEGETDPVKILGGLILDPAKAAPIADLFPDSFNGDGLPQGWDNKPIGDLVDTGGGATPRTKDLVYWEPATHHWATPKDLSGMQDLALWDTSRKISSEGLAKISSGLNPVGTVLLSSRAPIGYVAIAQVPVAVNQGFITLRPTGAISSSFLYLWCHAYMPAIKSNANGSTFQEISKKNFRPILTAVPNDDAVLEAFVEIVDPLIAKIVANAKENQTLAETRDYLLPKLMSGEVRVGDAASEASNVVGMDKDLFGRKHLPADQSAERDAVMVAAIIDLFDSDGYVVGNFRYQKGVYFLKRYLDLPQANTIKQAAGPYDSALRYEGGHKIAKDRRYIREAFINGKTGNKRGSKISEAKAQIDKFGLREALTWVSNNKLRFKSNDELECLATVDFAMNELRARGSAITVDAIIQDINRDDVWRPKLTKAHFRRDKIRDAIAELNKLFGTV